MTEFEKDQQNDVNTINYEYVAKKLEKQVEICADESRRRHNMIQRMEKRISELENTIHHQNILLSAYKDVVFNYQAKLSKYEEKYGELE